MARIPERVPMQCAVLRASRRDEMYVYVRTLPSGEPELSLLSAEVQQALGRLTPVMTLDLDGRERLARVSIEQVRTALLTQGFYVQMPPDGLINPAAVAPEGLRGA